MANYIFKPSDYSVGTNLETLGWTRRFVINADTWTIQEPTPGVKTLRFTKASASTARSAISWDILDSDAGKVNIDALSVFRGRETTSNDCSIRVFARGSGASATETAVYAGTTIGSNLNYILGQLVAGTTTSFDTGTQVSGANYRNSDTWLAQRVRINGTDVYWKFWVPADPNNPEADEPSLWSKDEFGVSTVTDAGWVGIIRQIHGNHEYLKFAFATGGDVATFTESADIDPPILTSPTATATSSTAASGSISTNEGNGTLYYLASSNSTETGTTVKAGSSQSVSASGVQNVSVSGLTASTSYYLHYLHRDAAGNDSTVASSAQFTTQAAPEVPPAGTVTISTPTYDHESALVPFTYSAADADGFEYRLNGGTPVDIGLVSEFNLAGLTENTEYTVEVRAYNGAGAGAWSSPSVFTTEAAPVSGVTLTLEPLKNNTGTVWASKSGITALVYALTGELVVSLPSQSTNASGVLVVTHSSLVTATQYFVVVKFDTGEYGITKVTSS